MADKPTYERNHSQNDAEYQYQWKQGQIIEADLLNNMQSQIASNTQGFSKLIEYNINQPVSPYNQIWLKPTNRQEDTIRLAEVKDLDKVAIISDQPPNENLNKIWIHNTETGEYVPTYNEFTQTIEDAIAPSYLNTATYNVGEYITYENKLYMCQTAVTTPGEWTKNSSHFIKISVAGPLDNNNSSKGGWPNINANILNAINTQYNNRIETNNNIQSKINNIENSIAPVYSEISYNIDDYCMHDGKLYKCKSTIINGEDWNDVHWTQVTTKDEIDNLKSVIEACTSTSVKILELTTDDEHLLGYKSGKFDITDHGRSITAGNDCRTLGDLPVYPGEEITITPSAGKTATLCVFTGTPSFLSNADNSAIFDSGVSFTEPYTFRAVKGKYYYVTTNTKYTEISASNIPVITHNSEIGARFDEVEGLLDNVVKTEWRDIWTYGAMNAGNGNVTESDTATSRIHTPLFLADGIIKISVSDGYKYEIAAYSKTDDSYVGIWNGTSFVTSTTWLTSDIYPADIGNYKFRLVAANSEGTDVDLAVAKTKIIFSAKTDITLSVPGMAADAYTVGEQLEGIGRSLDDLEGSIEGAQKTASSFVHTGWRNIWHYGVLNPSNGVIGSESQTHRIYSDFFTRDSIIKISISDDYRFEIAAYNKSSGQYAGIWNGTSFVTTKTWLTTDIFPADIGDYKFRLAVADRTNDTTAVTIDIDDAKTSVIFAEKTDITLSTPGVAADAYATGERINNLKGLLVGKKIVNMGDSIFGYFVAPNDISTFLAEQTGAEVYNCALGGTRAVERGGNTSGDDGEDSDNTNTAKPFDLSRLVTALISDDANRFSAQDNAVGTHSVPFQTHFALLKTIDFSTIDILTIAYGTNDYAASSDESDITDFVNALATAATQMMTKFPNLRVVFCTPTFRIMGSTGNLVPADTYQNRNGDTLTDYVDAVKMAAETIHTYAIDLYHLGVNALNYTQYCIDKVHPNLEGRKIIANRISKNLC